MKIETLGSLLKEAGRKSPTIQPRTRLHARVMIYQQVGAYLVAAEELSRFESVSGRLGTSQALGALIHAVALDAQINLTPEKFALLDGYPLTEEHHELSLNRDRLFEALVDTWGGEDIFIERLSGGLFGSYLKALSALKPHARALGHDLSTAATAYLKTL